MRSLKNIYLPSLLLHPLVLVILVVMVACQKDESSSGSSNVVVPEEEEEEALTDDELMTLVQRQTFKYFWDYAHSSGLAHERSNGSTNVATIGGSGFGVMAIIVAIERQFITREEGAERMLQIVKFLSEEADMYYGMWPHWINGTTGETIAFSSNDDGADIVESAFMYQGLLAAHQYFDKESDSESSIREIINSLWEGAQWDWFTQGGQDMLYWHWSPNYGWEKNLAITGFNECHITYILAASSPTHPIETSVYHNGWTSSNSFTNGKSYYGITLPLGQEYGGPLFFAHYSYLGLNPFGLEDRYASYEEQVTAHTLINRAYCINNPKDYFGYSANSWGITASDNYEGYSAHSPTNDLGVITPTAAISSIPYTPEYSLTAMRYFYETLGDNLWGEYGFKDAFSLSNYWYASSYLAIDQGPIIVMIENYRTGLIWDLFMSHPDVQNGLRRLEFSSPYLD
ncbi:MAG: glucoamylase family protein [Rikenellaceae bacterium]